MRHMKYIKLKITSKYIKNIYINFIIKFNKTYEIITL